eukprot:Gb_21312 [translate_table: standard]
MVVLCKWNEGRSDISVLCFSLIMLVEVDHICVANGASFEEGYPMEPPELELIDSKGLDDHQHSYLLSEIQNVAKELVSCPMLVALCEKSHFHGLSYALVHNEAGVGDGYPGKGCLYNLDNDYNGDVPGIAAESSY